LDDRTITGTSPSGSDSRSTAAPAQWPRRGWSHGAYYYPNLIQIIKEVRATFAGAGLKEAKDLVEEVIGRLP
jgi:hypothetical protein